MVGCHRKNSGLTLVELLVVVVILTLLVAVVLPLAQPTPSQRLVREASRQVNAFLASAQSRAVGEQREYGVMLVPDASGEQCFDLMLAKVPPLYGGDEVTATATISSTNNMATLNGADRIVKSYQYDQTADGQNLFVGEGDRIRFNYRGPWYRIDAVSVSGGPPTVTFSYDVDNDGNNDAPLPPAGAAFAYQIRRKPRASAAGMMTLPTGAYIDLGFYGTDASGNTVFRPVSGEGASAPMSSQVVMFDATGRPNSDSIYLLVSSKPSTPVANAAGKWANGIRNLLVDAPSIWIAVNGSNGRITTAENVAHVSLAGSSATVTKVNGTVQTYELNDTDRRVEAWDEAIAASRASVLTGPTMGGQ